MQYLSNTGQDIDALGRSFKHFFLNNRKIKTVFFRRHCRLVVTCLHARIAYDDHYNMRSVRSIKTSV